MNMVKRSIEMKNPNTPVDSSRSHMKKWRASSIFHEANEPANTIIDERMSMAIDTPSTPTARLMFSGPNHSQEPVKSISSVLPAWRRAI